VKKPFPNDFLQSSGNGFSLSPFPEIQEGTVIAVVLGNPRSGGKAACFPRIISRYHRRYWTAGRPATCLDMLLKWLALS
jgi:hypothetical protein